MPIEPIIADQSTLLAGQRLMRWVHLFYREPSDVTPYENAVLNELRFRLESRFFAGAFEEGLDRKIFFHNVFKHFPNLFNMLLPILFFTETTYSLWGRIIAQRVKVPITKNGVTVKFSEIPGFMRPMECLSCGKVLSEITPENCDYLNKWVCSSNDYKVTADQDVSDIEKRVKQCSDYWAQLISTYGQAFHKMIPPNDNLSPKENFDLLSKATPYVAGAYAFLCDYLEKDRPYTPRYQLIPEYKEVLAGWYVDILIMDAWPIKKEIVQPMFTAKLEGKFVHVAENMEGYPVDGEGQVVKSDNAVKLSDLKRFFIVPSLGKPRDKKKK